MTPMEFLLRDLVVANRILANEGVVDAYGHVSVRSPDNPERYFLSCSRSPELVRRSDIMEFDLDGTAIGGMRATPISNASFMARPTRNSRTSTRSSTAMPTRFCPTPSPRRRCAR